MTASPAIATDQDEDSVSSLCVHVRFVTDRCVAACVDAREQPEWPPHPGRFYMALAAAFFETDGTPDEKQAERLALEWLASRPAPRIHAVDVEERTAVVCYVPVNDAPQPNKAMLQSAPGMSRSRQSRTFPTLIPDRRDQTGADVTFAWPTDPSSKEHLPALDRLCRNIVRIGHSSSLVMAWVETRQGDDDERGCWEPADNAAEFTCRIAVAGELERLRNSCRAEQIDLFAELKQEIESTKGKEQKAAKERFAEAFGTSYKTSLRPPEPTPPTLGVWQGYRTAPASRDTEQTVGENQYFERNLIILAKEEGPNLNIERTLGLTSALRKALISVHGEAAMPAWLTGHDPDGAPTSSPHAAFFTLPFAGFPHADGHVMGMAIALPKGISPRERSRWLSKLLVDRNSGEAAQPELKLWGRDLPGWTLQLEDRPSPPRSLQNETWTKPSTTWASVTPVVLDRFPKASRAENREDWHAEVVEILRRACSLGGLPEPLEIDIDSTAWHAGVPRAWAKSRGQRSRSHKPSAPLGDGFPALGAKPSRPAKPQIHVWLRFPYKVAGPVLIGAGRFTGYGLFMPVVAK